MKIRRLVLSDFGKFHQKEFTLSDGLNIATGPNECGKTTLRRFIRGMFYGLERERGIKARKDDYTRYKPWDYGQFRGILEFEAEGKEYRLSRDFLTTQKEVVLTEIATGRQIEDPAGFLRKLGLMSEAVYINTLWVGNFCATEELLGTELKDYLANLAYGGGSGVNLQKSLAWLTRRKKELVKQMPEQELADCMTLLLSEENLLEQLKRERQLQEVSLQRQKELKELLRAQTGVSEQMSRERKMAEEEERQKFRGEWLLTLFGMLAAGISGVACFLPFWSWKLLGFGLAALICLWGLVRGFSKIRRGKKAAQRKEELEQQLLCVAGQLEDYYEELTGLLPQTEQAKLSMEQLEEQLKQLEAVKERYEVLKHRKQSLWKEVEAVTLATDTLNRLSVELYEEFGAKFAAALSLYARAFTDHSYETLTADDDLVLRAVTGNRNLEVSDVSYGTGEQFYLALRFAAADVFDPEKKNLMILDDSFAAFDDQRLESAILTLKRCGRQILVLSSTGREEAAAKRMGITYEKIF